MQEDRRDLSRVVQGNCTNCRTALRLRLPSGIDSGKFMVKCSKCAKELLIDIRVDRTGRTVLVDGRTQSSQGTKDRASPPVELERPPGHDIEKEALPYRKRLMTATILLLLVGALGVSASALTLAVSFSIKDLEEQSSGESADLNLWTLDSLTGRGIEGATITLGQEDRNLSARSDQEGLAIIKDVPLGEMDLRISKEGYRTVSGSVVVRKGTPNVIDVPMQKGDPSEMSPLPVQQFKNRSFSPLYTDAAAALMMLSAIMAFVSAFFTYKRDFFGLALASSFLSIFSMGFFLGSILAFVAFILIILSYEGFEHTHHLLDQLERYRKGDVKRPIFGRETGQSRPRQNRTGPKRS